MTVIVAQAYPTRPRTSREQKRICKGQLPSENAILPKHAC